MANDFGANYIIGVTLENLNALKELRAELAALREDSKAPVDFVVNVKPNTADNIGRVVEEKVAEGIAKGTAKAKRGSSAGGSASGKDTVGFDPAAMAKLDALFSKVAAALERGPAAGGATVQATIDPKAIANAVAEGVREGMVRRERASTRTVDKPLTPARREALDAEAEDLNSVAKTPAALKKVTQQNTRDVINLLNARAEKIGGLFKKQVDELLEAVHTYDGGGATGTMKPAAGSDAAIHGIQEARDEMAAMIVAKANALSTQSMELLKERITAIDSALDKGVEQVQQKVRKGGSMKMLDQTLRRSTLKLEKAFENVGTRIAEQLGLFTESLVDRISSLQLNVSTSQIETAMAGAAAEAAQPTRARRRVTGPVPLRNDPIRAGGAFFDSQGREFAQTRADLSAEEREGLAAKGRMQLEAMQEKERKRQARLAKKDPKARAAYDKLDAQFYSMPLDDARRVYQEAGAYRVFTNERDSGVLRQAFGDDAVENRQGVDGVPIPKAEQMQKRLARFKRLVEAKKMSASLVVDQAEMAKDPVFGPLLDQDQAGRFASLTQFSDAAEVLKRTTKLTGFARANKERPEFSPVAVREALAAERARAEGLPEFMERTGTDALGNVITAKHAVRGPELERIARLEKFYQRKEQNALRQGYEFTPYGDPERGTILKGIQDAIGLTEGKVPEVKGIKPKYSDIQNGLTQMREETVGGFKEFQRKQTQEGGVHYNMQGKLGVSQAEALSDMLDRGGEWHFGAFEGFKSSVFAPENRDISLGASSRMLQQGPMPLSADLKRMMAPGVDRKELPASVKTAYELRLAESQRKKAMDAIIEIDSQMAELQAAVAKARNDVASLAAPPENTLGNQAAIEEYNQRAAGLNENVRLAEAAVPRAEARRKALMGDLTGGKGLDNTIQALKNRLAEEQLAEEHARQATLKEELLRKRFPERFQSVSTAAGAATDTAGMASARAAAQTADAIAASVGAGGAGGAGGGGGGGGSTGTPGMPEPGGDNWGKFLMVMRSLEGMRLEGLASDFASMAASMRELQKVGGSQWTQFMRAAGAKGKLDMMDKEIEKTRLKTDAQDRRTQAKRESTEAWLQAQGKWGMGKVGAGAQEAVGGLGDPSDTDGLPIAALADRFLKLDGQYSGKQLKFDTLMNRFGYGGGRDPRTMRQMENATLDMDAERHTMMDTVISAGMKSPKLNALGEKIDVYRENALNRVDAEAKYRDAMKAHDEAFVGPKVPAGMVDEDRSLKRAAAMEPLLKNLRELRTYEEAAAGAVLKTAKAEFEAIKATEQHGTWVERLSTKVRSLAMYATAGGLVYSAFAAARAGLGGAIDIESRSARLQGVLGNRSAAERDQVQAGVLQAGIDTGAANLGDGIDVAKRFAQTGMGAVGTIQSTRAALTAQQGMGLDGKQATDMLLTVDNVTKSLVTASDVMDRIARVESHYAVTAEDLSTAVQKVGGLATALQPNRVGRMDALDLVIGATTAQVEKTHASGEQTSAALRMILGRLGTPANIRQLQDTYGIKLAANKEGTELRPLFDIFSDISKTYKELLKKDAAHGGTGSGIAMQFLTAVAGARQENQAAALFGGWDTAMKAASDSARAWGDSQARLALQSDTLAFQLDRTKDAFLAFTSALLRGSGALGLGKALTWAAGTVGDKAKDNPDLALAVGGASLTGLAWLAKRAATRPGMVAAGEAFEAAGTAVPMATMLKANWKSLMEIFAMVAANLGAVLTGIGAIGVAVGVAYAGLKWYQGRNGPLANPNLDDAKLFDTDLYKNYSAYAQQNGQSASGLLATVGAAAQRAQTTIRGKREYFGIKDSIFTTDDDKRKYNTTLADATTAEFVKELSKAVPAIAAIKDEAERTAAALALLKQSSQVGQMQSSYVAGYQDEQLGALTKKMQASVLELSQNGVFGAKASKGFGASTEHLVGDSLKKAFGFVGEEVTGTSLLDASNKSGTMLTRIVEEMKSTGETFGQAFDKVASAALELTSAQLDVVAKLKAKGGLSTDPDLQRAQLIQQLGSMGGTEALGARRVLMNQRSLEGNIYERLKGEIPLVKNTVGDENQGGIKGSNLVFEALMNAGRRRVNDLRRAGLTGAALTAEQTLTTMQAPANRGAFDLMTMKGGNYKATFRDRILDQIIRYGQADASALEGGTALKEVGIRADVAADRSNAANSLVRGLFDAKAQGTGDVLRAASKLAAFSDLSSTMAHEGGAPQEGAQTDGAERSVLTERMLKAVGKMDPTEKRNLEMQLRAARQAAEMIGDRDDLFAGLPNEDQKTIREMLAPGYSKVGLSTQALNFVHIVDISKKLAKTMDEQLTAEHMRLETLRQRSETDTLILKLSNEELRAANQRKIRTMDTFGGAFTSFGVRMKDINDTHASAIEEADSVWRGKTAVLDLTRSIYADGGETLRLQNDEELKRAKRTADSNRDKSAADLRTERADDEANRLAQYRTRYMTLGTSGGAMAAARGEIMRSRESGVIGAANEQEALRSYQLSVRERYYGQATAMTQNAESGLKGSITSFDTFKGSALGARIIKPALDTMTNQVGSSFLNVLTGPQGLLGDKFAKFFNSQFFVESDMIRNAHIQGIMQGFGAVGIGPDAVGAAGVGADGVPTATGPGGGKAVNLAPISTSEKMKQLALTGGMIGGNILGGQLGTNMGVNNKNNYGSEGGQLGSTIGGAIGMSVGGPLGGAVGGLLGGVVGGLFGGRVGKQVDPPAYSALDRIDRNTRETVSAIENQTKGLLNLENRLLNVPANFVIPSYAVAGGGGAGEGSGAGGTTNITVNVTEAANAQVTAQLVTDQIQAQLRGAGSFVSPRLTRN